jgi:hypothetical protein
MYPHYSNKKRKKHYSTVLMTQKMIKYGIWEGQTSKPKNNWWWFHYL